MSLFALQRVFSYLHNANRKGKKQTSFFLPAHFYHNQLISVGVQGGGKWWCDLQLMRGGDMDITFIVTV